MESHVSFKTRGEWSDLLGSVLVTAALRETTQQHRPETSVPRARTGGTWVRVESGERVLAWTTNPVDVAVHLRSRRAQIDYAGWKAEGTLVLRAARRLRT